MAIVTTVSLSSRKDTYTQTGTPAKTCLHSAEAEAKAAVVVTFNRIIEPVQVSLHLFLLVEA